MCTPASSAFPESISAVQALPFQSQLKIHELQVQVEKEKAYLQSQCVDQQNKLRSLWKELLQAEQTHQNLESDSLPQGKINVPGDGETENLILHAATPPYSP